MPSSLNMLRFKRSQQLSFDMASTGIGSPNNSSFDRAGSANSSNPEQLPGQDLRAQHNYELHHRHQQQHVQCCPLSKTTRFAGSRNGSCNCSTSCRQQQQQLLLGRQLLQIAWWLAVSCLRAIINATCSALFSISTVILWPLMLLRLLNPWSKAKGKESVYQRELQQGSGAAAEARQQRVSGNGTLNGVQRQVSNSIVFEQPSGFGAHESSKRRGLLEVSSAVGPAP
jgi:hypothetical protein